MNKIMIALLTGFVAGLLLAPHKGSFTRKKLVDGAEQLSDELSDILENFTAGNANPEEETFILPKMNTLI